MYGAPEGVFQSSFSTQLAAPLFFPARPTYGSAELPATAALDGTAGAEIQFDGQDTKIVILIENSGSSAGDVTFKAGNGIQGVADLVVNVANGKTKAVVLESGAFKKAGKVIVTGAATMKAAALLLP